MYAVTTHPEFKIFSEELILFRFFFGESGFESDPIQVILILKIRKKI